MSQPHRFGLILGEALDCKHEWARGRIHYCQVHVMTAPERNAEGREELSRVCCVMTPIQEVLMRQLTVSLLLVSALVLATTPTSADIKKPCPAGQREVVSRDGKIVCFATYASRGRF
jgi:hypothetical protein